MIIPASHPATAPISKKMTRPTSVICFPLRGPLAGRCHLTVICNQGVVTQGESFLPEILMKYASASKKHHTRLDVQLFARMLDMVTLDESPQADRKAPRDAMRAPADVVPARQIDRQSTRLRYTLAK